MKITIDRIENNTAVCETDGKKMIHIPVDHFPNFPCSGEIYDKSGDCLTFLLQDTEEKRQTVKNRFSKLVKRKK